MIAIDLVPPIINEYDYSRLWQFRLDFSSDKDSMDLEVNVAPVFQFQHIGWQCIFQSKLCFKSI